MSGRDSHYCASEYKGCPASLCIGITAWIIVNTSMTWDEVLELSPERLKFVAKAIEKRRTRDKLAIFDAQAALIDEKSLSRLNSELRENEKG